MALAIVTDNGPAFKSTTFLGFIRARPYLTHIRTRHHAPETNGVAERFSGTLKYEHLFREDIADVIELEHEVARFRRIYNTIRPHEALGFGTPISAYLALPRATPISGRKCPRFLTRGTRWRS
jgi:transposase InsO family protein